MESQLDRRDLTNLLMAAAAAAALPQATAFATPSQPSSAVSTPSTTPSSQAKAIVEAALKCLSVGEACASHCIEMLGRGKKDMADCLASVRVNLAACQALVTVAGSSSKRLKSFAAVCADICADCAKECEKHIKMPECKACMDACLECEKVCRAA